MKRRICARIAESLGEEQQASLVILSGTKDLARRYEVLLKHDYPVACHPESKPLSETKGKRRIWLGERDAERSEA